MRKYKWFGHLAPIWYEASPPLTVISTGVITHQHTLKKIFGLFLVITSKMFESRVTPVKKKQSCIVHFTALTCWTIRDDFILNSLNFWMELWKYRHKWLTYRKSNRLLSPQRRKQIGGTQQRCNSPRAGKHRFPPEQKHSDYNRIFEEGFPIICTLHLQNTGNSEEKLCCANNKHQHFFPPWKMNQILMECIL